MVYPDDKPVPASHHLTRAQLAKLPLPSTAGNHSILGHSNGAPVTGTKAKQQQVLPVLPSRRPALWSWPWQNCSNTAPLSEVVSMLSIVPSVLLGLPRHISLSTLYQVPHVLPSAQCSMTVNQVETGTAPATFTRAEHRAAFSLVRVTNSCTPHSSVSRERSATGEFSRRIG